MDRPVPDPAKLLQEWMEWERGDSTPGAVMSALKTGGLRDVLEALVAQAPKAEAGTDDAPSEEAWTPVV